MLKIVVVGLVALSVLVVVTGCGGGGGNAFDASKYRIDVYQRVGADGSLVLLGPNEPVNDLENQVGVEISAEDKYQPEPTNIILTWRWADTGERFYPTIFYTSKGRIYQIGSISKDRVVDLSAIFVVGTTTHSLNRKFTVLSGRG